jgi:hypothetical protein
MIERKFLFKKYNIKQTNKQHQIPQTNKTIKRTRKTKSLRDD